MARDPSIHITKSVLIRLIEEEHSKLPAGFVERLFNKARKYSCSSRSVFASTKKLEEKVVKLKLASRSNAAMFAQTLLFLRRKAKHRGIQLINAGDKEWLTLKDICKNATEFCNEFGFSLKLGYREYIAQGLNLMNGGYSLNKFKFLHTPICNRYESLQEIELDRNANRTAKGHNTFMAIVSQKTGFSTDYSKDPDKYKFFVRASREAGDIGISIEDYIRAQFDAFEWNSSIPEPTQIAGEKARERVMKYCYKNNLQTNKTLKQEKAINFAKIRKSKNRHK